MFICLLICFLLAAAMLFPYSLIWDQDSCKNGYIFWSIIPFVAYILYVFALYCDLADLFFKLKYRIKQKRYSTGHERLDKIVRDLYEQISVDDSCHRLRFYIDPEERGVNIVGNNSVLISQSLFEALSDEELHAMLLHSIFVHQVSRPKLFTVLSYGNPFVFFCSIGYLPFFIVTAFFKLIGPGCLLKLVIYLFRFAVLFFRTLFIKFVLDRSVLYLADLYVVYNGFETALVSAISSEKELHLNCLHGFGVSSKKRIEKLNGFQDNALHSRRVNTKL